MCYNHEKSRGYTSRVYDNTYKFYIQIKINTNHIFFKYFYIIDLTLDKFVYKIN